MKFEIKAGDLASAAAYAAEAIPAKPENPMLAGMKIVASDGRIVLTGSDNIAIATARADADVHEPGTAVIPGNLFAGITKGLPAGDLAHLVTKGTEAVLGYGGGEYSLVTLAAETYPSLPEPAAPAGKAAADLLAVAISRTTGAVARNEALLVEITAVQMIIEDDRITFNATDRYRLVQASLLWQAEAPVRDLRPALVPAAHLNALARAVPSEQNVSVGLADGIVTFASPDRSLTCRLITGEGFPKAHRQIAPFAAPSATATVDRRALDKAIGRVAAVADRNTPVFLKFSAGEVKVTGGGGRGHGSEAVWAVLDGPVQEAGFQPGYLHEALEAAGTETVMIAFTAPKRPVLITDGAEEGARDDSFRIVQMPQMPEAVGSMAVQK